MTPNQTRNWLMSYIRSSDLRKLKLQQLASDFEMTVMFLPPYYPELNPQEKVWRLVKPLMRGAFSDGGSWEARLTVKLDLPE